MRRRSSRTSGWPRTSSKWTSRTPSEAGRRGRDPRGRYRWLTITPRRRPSAPAGHLRPRERDEPAHLRPRSLRIHCDLASHRRTALRVVCRADVLFDLLPSPTAILGVPDVEIPPATNRLDTIAATDHHRLHRSEVDSMKCYRYLTITGDGRIRSPDRFDSSQELHQVRLREDARDLAFRGHEDRAVVSQQARSELDGRLRVDLRERRLHDLVHSDPREVLRVFPGQDQVVDHLVRNRADRMAVVHDGHLGELPAAHLLDRVREGDLRFDVLDLLRLDLLDERLLLLPLQLGLEGRHHAPDDVVGGVHLLLLDLHDRRLADVRQARERGLCEPEGLPQARDLLQVRHHRNGNGHTVHIPAGIFRTIVYDWLMDRLREAAGVPSRPADVRQAGDKSHICTSASTPHSRRRLSVARNIYVEELIHTPIEQQSSEIVERKGIGHPDSIADGLAEIVSRALSKMYLQRFGRILHHNTDQVEVVGGQSAPKFGGGVFLEPAYILLVGRATTMVNGERLPYRTAAIQPAHHYLTTTYTNLNV